MELHEYAAHDATGLAERVRRKDVTPLELVDLAIRAVEQVDAQLDAVVHRHFEAARARATGPLEGPFAGVPYVLKDFDGSAAGEPYGMGTRFMQGYVAPHDAEIIARQRAAGLIWVARTKLPELALLGTTEPEAHGPTRNPWSPVHSVGGSSGGSAALVAARAVPMGHAGDGGGSIRIPASACALFGLKPTRGRNPLGPDAAEGWGGYAQPHAVTRSVRDCAILLDATCGPDVGAPYFAPPPERPFAEEVGAPPGKLRIAYTTESLFGRSTHPDCAAAVMDAVKLLEELGHEVVEAKPTFDRDALVRAYLVQVAVGAASQIDACGRMQGVAPTAEGFEASTWFLAQVGWSLTAMELHEAREAGLQSHRSVAPFFERHDLLLTATMAYPPPLIGELDLKRRERVGLAVLRRAPVRAVLQKALADLADQSLDKTANTMLFNQTGQPAMSVPLWWTPAGLPIGVQLAGRYGDEATLFRLAAQLEEARPWADRRPQVVAG